MRGKSLVLLILALGCGLAASLGITQVLKRGDPPPSNTTPVFVAKADIATGALINEENTKTEQWPKDRIPAGAAIHQEDIDGRRARQKIFAGEPIIDPKLLARGQVPTDSLVPKGFRVVAVSVGPEAIHGGLVLPGARCDVQVFIRQDASMGVGETLCKTVLQDIRVFAVNDVTSTESLDPKTPDTRSIPGGKTVSLLVTPAQAQIVTLAGQLGMIRLILRSGDDNEQPKTVAMTAHELLGAFGGSDRAKENPGASGEKRFLEWAEQMRKMMREEAKAGPAKAAAVDSAQHYTMRVRLGPKDENGKKTNPEVIDVLLINRSSLQGMPDNEGAWTVLGMGSSPHGKLNGDSHDSNPVEMGSPASPVGPILPTRPDDSVPPPSKLPSLRPASS